MEKQISGLKIHKPMDQPEDWGAREAQIIEQYCRLQKNWRGKRQAEGIAAAKAKGVRFGRPRIAPPKNFGEIVKAWEGKNLSMQDVLQICGMSQTTFFRRLRQYRLECGIEE